MEEKHFIADHLSEILPTLSEQDFDLLKGFADIEAIEDESFIKRAVEGFENRLFVQEKDRFDQDAKRVLVAVNDTGAYRAVKSLIANLQKDDRCRSVAVVTGGVSNKFFPADFGIDFQEVRTTDQPFMVDLLSYSKDQPFDIVIGSVSYINGPESLALVGKENFGASKTFLIFEGWASGMGSGVDMVKDKEAGNVAVSNFDGIFCNPGGLAKKIIKTHLPDFSENKIFETGTPNLDDMDIGNREQLRQSGRQKLGLVDKDFSVLFWGDYSAYPEYDADPLINQKTFEETLLSLIDLAKDNPNYQFAFLFRPHPGGGNDKYGFGEIVAQFKSCFSL